MAVLKFFKNNKNKSRKLVYNLSRKYLNVIIKLINIGSNY